MYTEATGQSEGDNAKLQLVVPRSLVNSSACLTFFYHMYGSSMGTLNVFNGNTTIYTASGDHGNNWRKIARTVNSNDVVSMHEFCAPLISAIRSIFVFKAFEKSLDMCMCKCLWAYTFAYVHIWA